MGPERAVHTPSGARLTPTATRAAPVLHVVNILREAFYLKNARTEGLQRGREEGGREGGSEQEGTGVSAPGRDLRDKDTARVTMHTAGVPMGSPSLSSLSPVSS